MFDDYARSLIDRLPDLPGLDRAECRRALSAAYFHIIRSRIEGPDDDSCSADLMDVRFLLRRMADGLESVAVFDRLRGTAPDKELTTACAFVAAESLAMLSELCVNPEEDAPQLDVLQTPQNYMAIESALLYMIGGYDINASSMVERVRDDLLPAGDDLESAQLSLASYLLNRIRNLCRGIVERTDYQVPDFIGREMPVLYDGLFQEVRSQLYLLMGQAVDLYLRWLGGYDDARWEDAMEHLELVRSASVPGMDYAGMMLDTAFGDIHHLASLLMVAVEETRGRSVVYGVPHPEEGADTITLAFPGYLRARARGTEDTPGRPFLWPSASAYVSECLPGPRCDAVVSMPTGSGKSFLAELAIAQAVARGWVLYLVPTNALAHQVRRDLSRALESFVYVTVRSFVGSEDYTTLSEEFVQVEERLFVAVMTPEKCALALRLNPGVFESCALCVFDECHLLNDPGRGVTSDVLLARLSLVAPGIRYLLMSAMVGNAERLAAWLRDTRATDASATAVKWRPSRTLRGLLVIDEQSMREGYQGANRILRTLPAHRKRQSFDARLALIAGLSGPWTLDGPLDYRCCSLPVAVPLAAVRGSAQPQVDSWKNPASRLISERLAQYGIPVINFILSSRHHAFSSAEHTNAEIPGSIRNADEFPPLVLAWLVISDAELGVPSVVRELLQRGLAVHTSAMLQTEQAASEWMFRHGHAKLMFATGTLAQGLNLPAVAVVVSGTSMGDPRHSDADTPYGLDHVNGVILNSFGRAGRPGFSNQGVAILVSDRPYTATVTLTLHPRNALDQYQVLARPDAVVEVHSPVERFLDAAFADDGGLMAASNTELELTALLADLQDDSNTAGEVLRRTFGGYNREQLFSPEGLQRINLGISRVKEHYLQQPDVPDWIVKAAMESGRDFFRTWRMWRAYCERGMVGAADAPNMGVTDWLDVLIEVMSWLPPHRIEGYLAEEGARTQTVLTRLRDHVQGRLAADDLPWDRPEGWPDLWDELKQLVLLFMRGAPYAELAQGYFGKAPEEISNSRTQGGADIPAVFKFRQKVIEPLALDAGCFVAIHELAQSEQDGEEVSVPEALAALPLCIRNGCDSLHVLSWFRFGYRQRVCAHELARAFRIPENLADDSARRDWVRGAMSSWRDDVIEPDYDRHPLLRNVKTVLDEGSQVED